MEERYRKTVSLAAAMLGRRSLSENQLRRKLAEKEQEPQSVDYAVRYMKELGALDDEQYARLHAQSLCDRGYGQRRIVMTLQQKGIDRELAQSAAEEVRRPNDPLLEMLLKRCQGRRPDERERQRICAAMARRGFDYDEIKQAWDRYDSELEGEK